MRKNKCFVLSPLALLQNNPQSRCAASLAEIKKERRENPGLLRHTQTMRPEMKCSTHLTSMERVGDVMIKHDSLLLAPVVRSSASIAGIARVYFFLLEH